MANVSSSNGLEKRPKLRFPGFDEPYRTTPLGEIASLVNRTDPKSNAPIMMLSAGNGFIMQSEKYSRDNAGQSLKKYILLKQGELAYNHGASKAKQFGCCYELTEPEARIPYVYHCFKINEDEYTPYVAMALNNSKMDQQLKRLVSSSVRMDGLLNISFEDYMSVTLYLPSFIEQKHIADFLKKLDERIAYQERLITSLKKYKRGLNKLVFEKITSGAKQQIPLSELCESISSGRTTSSNADGIFPLFGSTGVVGKTNIIEFDGDIVLIARVGANAGKVNYFSGQCAVTDNTLVIRVKENLVQAKFLAFFLEYYNLHRLIFGSGQPLVTGGQLKKIKMPLVSLTTQVSLTQRLEALDSIIEVHEKYAQSLTLLKSGLMQQLFI